jgi:hypothetical protein
MLQVNNHLHKSSGVKFSIFPLYQILSDSDNFREEKERHITTNKCSVVNVVQS